MNIQCEEWNGDGLSVLNGDELTEPMDNGSWLDYLGQSMAVKEDQRSVMRNKKKKQRDEKE